MRTQLITALAVVMLCAPGHAPAQTTAPPAKPSAPAKPAAAARHTEDGLAPRLVGTWKATPYERELDTDFDKSVWGSGAVSVRNVDLAIRATGAATLTVTTRVLDARKRPVAASTSIEVAELVIGAAQGTVGVRTDHAVKVTSAERRYPDDPKSTWPLDGLRVQVTTFEDDPGSIDLRFDTPEGRGSFWELLKRQGTAARPAPRP